MNDIVIFQIIVNSKTC